MYNVLVSDSKRGNVVGKLLELPLTLIVTEISKQDMNLSIYPVIC